MSAALAAFPPSEPRGTEMRSLLDDLTPAPSLKDLAAASRDFRGCGGGDWNHVADFWTADVVGLYALTSAAGVDDPNDPAIKLIEISVASADAEDP
jgi:hypothetical protein